MINAQIVNGDYIGMIESGDGLCLILKAGPGRLIECFQIQRFQGEFFIETGLAHAIDVAHASRANPAKNFIAAVNYGARPQYLASEQVYLAYVGLSRSLRRRSYFSRLKDGNLGLWDGVVQFAVHLQALPGAFTSFGENCRRLGRGQVRLVPRVAVGCRAIGETALRPTAPSCIRLHQI